MADQLLPKWASPVADPHPFYEHLWPDPTPSADRLPGSLLGRWWTVHILHQSSARRYRPVMNRCTPVLNGPPSRANLLAGREKAETVKGMAPSVTSRRRNDSSPDT